MVVHQIRERVAHQKDGIKARANILVPHVCGEGHPVARMDLPVKEGFLSLMFPPSLQRVLEHLVGEICRSEGEAGSGAHLLDQHHGVDPSATGSIHDPCCLVLLEQIAEEVLVVGRPLLLLPDVEPPVLGSLAIGVLVLDPRQTHAWADLQQQRKWWQSQE